MFRWMIPVVSVLVAVRVYAAQPQTPPTLSISQDLAMKIHARLSDDEKALPAEVARRVGVLFRQIANNGKDYARDPVAVLTRIVDNPGLFNPNAVVVDAGGSNVSCPHQCADTHNAAVVSCESQFYYDRQHASDNCQGLDLPAFNACRAVYFGQAVTNYTSCLNGALAAQLGCIAGCF